MVAANRSSNAYQLEFEEGYSPSSAETAVPSQPKPQVKAKKEIVPKAQARPGKTHKVLGLIALAAGFALAIALVTRFADMSRYSTQINDLRTELAEAEKVSEDLEFQLSSAQNLKQVMEQASGALDMGIPSESQLRKVAIAPVSVRETAQEAPPRGVQKWIGYGKEILGKAIDWLQ